MNPPGVDAPASPGFECAACGAILSGDLDEDPAGGAGRPICGECERGRTFDVDLRLMAEDD